MKEEYGFDMFLESSAKTGFNAKEIFVEAAKLLYKDYQLYSKVKLYYSFSKSILFPIKNVLISGLAYDFISLIHISTSLNDFSLYNIYINYNILFY